MNKLVNIRLELGINAQKFIQQVQLHHGLVEEQIAKGIELALNDVCEGDDFVQLIRESTKTELTNIVKNTILSYQTRSTIEKLIAEKVQIKIGEYADVVASKLTESLNIK